MNRDRPQSVATPGKARAERADEVPGQVAPCRSRVYGLQNSRAVIGIARKILLAGSHVNHIGVGRRNSDRANGQGWLIVSEGSPVDSGIHRFPDSTACATDIHDVRVARIHGQRRSPPGRDRRPIGREQKNSFRPGTDQSPAVRGSGKVFCAVRLSDLHPLHRIQCPDSRPRRNRCPRIGSQVLKPLRTASIGFTFVLSRRNRHRTDT